jgi:hypothetical protein
MAKFKQFVFSDYIIICLEKSNCPKIGFQNFLQDLVDTLTNSKTNYITPDFSSRIKQRQYDVPEYLKESTRSKDFNDRVEDFLKRNIAKENICSFVVEIKELIQNDVDLTSDEKENLLSINDYNEFIVSSLKAVILKNNIFKFNRKLFSHSKNHIYLEVDDIMSLAFNKKERIKDKVVVIPFDKDYHLNVTKCCDDNVEVSSNTLHGKWILKMIKNRVSFKEIVNKIKKESTSSQIGKIIKYPFGNEVFYLVALSEFDENNNAHCNKQDITKCVENILDEYNKTGQGVDLYIPLLGTGMSRAGLSLKESVDLILECCKKNEGKIQGDIHLVIYKKYAMENLEVLNELGN